jgi:hypothetical protein
MAEARELGEVARFALRLVALVVLQIHPLKGIFLPDHRDFTVQCQFSHTRCTLYIILHTNHPSVGPTHKIFLIPPTASSLLISLLSSTSPAPTCASHLGHSAPIAGAPAPPCAGLDERDEEALSGEPPTSAPLCETLLFPRVEIQIRRPWPRSGVVGGSRRWSLEAQTPGRRPSSPSAPRPTLCLPPSLRPSGRLMVPPQSRRRPFPCSSSSACGPRRPRSCDQDGGVGPRAARFSLFFSAAPLYSPAGRGAALLTMARKTNDDVRWDRCGAAAGRSARTGLRCIWGKRDANGRYRRQCRPPVRA